MSFTLPLYRKAITASIAAAQSMPLRCRRTATMATARTVSTPNNVADEMYPIHLHAISPSKLVNFTSHEGKRLFRGAMDQGHTESFFKLMGNFSTQSSPMLGGVSSLAMALNALEIDPKRRWKGNWRWYSDELLETCSSKEEVLLRGMSFDEFSCLAQSHCHVEARRARFTRYQQFLQDLEAITANNSRQVMVISYSRSRIGQMGQQGGHFSPIGGYNKEENMVLIMDVARGQYPSVWVDAELLFQSMQERELDILGKSRGYFLLQAPQQHQSFMTDRSPNKCSGCSRQCSKRFQVPTTATTTTAATATAAH